MGNTSSRRSPSISKSKSVISYPKTTLYILLLDFQYLSSLSRKNTVFLTLIYRIHPICRSNFMRHADPIPPPCHPENRSTAILTRSAAPRLAFEGGKEAPLGVNPEPSTRAQAAGQTPPASRRVDRGFPHMYKLTN
jgi:hypothetical protein